MGLDGVMIVLEAEKAFGLRIPDSDARAMLTPRHMVDWLAARLPLRDEPRCLAQRTFYRLRQGLAVATGRDPKSITLATPLSTLATKDTWSVVWAAARSHADAPDWPPLLKRAGIFGWGPRTVRDIVEHILMEWVDRRVAPSAPWTRSRIEYTVRRIILVETGLKGFRLTKTFVRDLGIH